LKKTPDLSEYSQFLIEGDEGKFQYPNLNFENREEDLDRYMGELQFLIKKTISNPAERKDPYTTLPGSLADYPEILHAYKRIIELKQITLLQTFT